MKKNIGLADKIVRLLVSAIVVVLFTTGIISGLFGIILIVLAGVFLLTSLIGVCPLYLPFGLSTRRLRKQAE